MHFDDREALQNEFGRKNRYDYAKIKKNQRTFFLKTALEPDGIENLGRELVWQNFMGHVRQAFPGLGVRAPRDMKLLRPTHLRMEYIDAPLLATPRESQGWVDAIERFADVLACFDIAATSYTVPNELRAYKPRDMYTTLERWLRDVPQDDDISRALRLVHSVHDRLSYRMQHGDLTAWQIFVVEDEWIVFDGERSGDDLPRFNDLAYAYGRLAIRCGKPDAADKMLRLFIDGVNLSRQEFFEQFIPVLTIRLLGFVGEATRDNLQEEHQRASTLLAMILDDQFQDRIRQ